MKHKSTFSLVQQKAFFLELVKQTDQNILARWAIDCAERVMPYFEEKYPDDKRPRVALETLQKWIETGEFTMRVIRKASLDSHAAAKEIGNDSPAASVAHAAGQAVATAHVPTHAIGAAIYVLQAIHRATGSGEEVIKEREWQYQQLLALQKNSYK